MKIEQARMASIDITEENIKKICDIFPSVAKEVEIDGKLTKQIDFDELKQELSSYLIEDKQERYQMTWPGKKSSVLLANANTSRTLRPIREKSISFDNTENVYIEGDNLETLKLLRENYLNKVKMIYIDPPYNTGNDFLYDDDFNDDAFSFYTKDLQQIDGKKMVENTSSLGRFHTNWLNSIYPRIKIARDLLSDDGVMFISIDDHEIDNLIKISKEIFGNEHVDVMVWRKSGAGRDGKMKNTSTFRKDHEYVVVCFKDILMLNKSFEKPNFVNEYPNPDNDPRGPYKAGSISRTEEASNPNHKNYYTVTSPAGVSFTRQFDISKEEFDRLNNDKIPNDKGKMVGRIYWGKNDDACPSIKIFVNEKRSVTTSSYIIHPNDFINSNTIDDSESTTTKGSKELEELLGVEGIGSEMRPKPTHLIKNLIQIGTNKDSIVVDFYSGSGTTAQAVFEQNLEDGGSRRFICVQVPQENASDTIAFKSGYSSICELAEQRIKISGEIIKKSNNIFENVDTGFRVFKLDSSNMNNVYYNPKVVTQNLLEATVDNIKPDRTALDLLFQVMLECGALLSSKIEEKTINSKKVYVVEDNYIAACFDDELDDKTIEEIAKLHPVYACFKGSSFNTDSANINAEQIFKTYSPNTEKVKVI